MQSLVYTSPTPTRSRFDQYWHGFDLHVAEVFDGAVVTLVDLSPDERRGYDAACTAEDEACIEADGQFLRDWMGN